MINERAGIRIHWMLTFGEKETSSPSIAEVVQNLSEDITISINKHSFARVFIPGFGHEFSKHRLGMAIDDGT